MVTLTCQECGKQYERYPSTAGPFCSRTCSGRSATREQIAGNSRKPKRGVTLACEVCGAEFYVSQCWVGKRKYCSVACRGLAQRRTDTIDCAECGKSFEAPQSAFKKFCSHACYSRNLAESRAPVAACLVCGNPVKTPRHRYCSRPCFLARPKQGREGSCAVCGASFYIPPHLEGVRKYCSNACRDEAKRLDGPGARFMRQDGYIRVYYPKHPNASARGEVMEHRIVMEQHLGRLLTADEQVHHVDGNRANNDISNLEVVAPDYHARITVAETTKKRRSEAEELAEYRRRFGPLKED